MDPDRGTSGRYWPGGLECVDELGLPYGKLGLRTKGFLTSAEKAWRIESTCRCMSGIGQAPMHFSRIRICRVKYSRASLFS